MDNETIITQFEALERKVESMIESSKALEAANRDLTVKVEQLEEQLQKASEMESRHKDSKDMIRSKIDNLLAKLDGIAETP